MTFHIIDESDRCLKCKETDVSAGMPWCCQFLCISVEYEVNEK